MATVTVLSKSDFRPLQEFVVPWAGHPISKMGIARIGNKHPFKGGITRPYKDDYEAENKDWCHQQPTTTACDVLLSLLLEVESEPPEAGAVVKVDIGDNRDPRKTLIGVRHGHQKPQFENFPGKAYFYLAFKWFLPKNVPL